MSPSELILAAMLLSAPAGTPEQVPTADRWPTIQAAIHKTAIDWEILDTRETRYVLARPEDFQEDLDFLRKRRIDFEDTPRVIESDRLPGRQMVNDNIRFNRLSQKPGNSIGMGAGSSRCYHRGNPGNRAALQDLGRRARCQVRLSLHHRSQTCAQKTKGNARAG